MNVTFDIGTDINIATLDVQNRVSIATPLLPAAVSRLGLTVAPSTQHAHDGGDLRSGRIARYHLSR